MPRFLLLLACAFAASPARAEVAFEYGDADLAAGLSELTQTSGGLFFRFNKDSARDKLLAVVDQGLGVSGASLTPEGRLDVPDEADGVFAEVVREAAASGGVVSIKVIERGEHRADQVMGGSFTAGIIDIDDIKMFGSDPAMNAVSVFAHEVKEQFERQVNRRARPEAHALGEAVESRITGWTRGKDSEMRGKRLDQVVARRAVGTETYFTASGQKDFVFHRGAETAILTVDISRRDIVKVSYRVE